MANGPLTRGGQAQCHVDGLVWVDGVLHLRTTTYWLDEAGDEITSPGAGTRVDTEDDDRPRARLSLRAQASGAVRELPTRSDIEDVAMPGDRVAVRVHAEAQLDPRIFAPDAAPGTWDVLAELPGKAMPHAVQVPEGTPGRPAVVGSVAYHAYRTEHGTLSIEAGARADSIVGASRPRTAEAVLRTAPDDEGRRTVRLTVPLDGIRVFPTAGRRVVAQGTAELERPFGTDASNVPLWGRDRSSVPTSPGSFRLVVAGEDVELQVTVPATPGRWQVVLTPRGTGGRARFLVHLRRFLRPRILSAGRGQSAADSEAPLVSVVVPVHNGEDTVEEAVRSVFAQTLPAEQIEIIAVDDGSTDGSLAILRRLESGRPQMRVFTQPASGTAAAPRNKGIDAATGRHLFFLDADDLLTPTALEKMTDAADALGADVVLGKMEGFAGRTNVPHRVFKRPSVDADMVENAMMKALGPTKLFRRSHVKERGLRFPAGLRHGEDQAFVAEAELTARRIVILTDTVYYRVRGHEPVRGARRGRAAIDIRLLKTRLVAGAVERHTEPGQRRDALLPRPFSDRALEGVFRRVYLALDPAEQAELVDRVVDEFGHLWTPGLRARVHPHARPLYDLVFRRDPVNVAALVRHAGGNVRLLPVVVDRDGFCLDVPSSVADALGREAFGVKPPRFEHRLTRLTTSEGHVVARGRMQPRAAEGPLPDGVHAEWRLRRAAKDTVRPVLAEATVLRTVEEPEQEAVVFSVDTEVTALAASGLWDLWVAPIWKGWVGPAVRFGKNRDASVDPDAVVVEGSPSVLHTNPRTGGISIDRGGTHHEVPAVQLTALRIDPDGRPEAVLRVPAVTSTMRVYADVEAEESRDARHRLPWTRVDDEHLAARLPVPFTTTTLPLTLAVSFEGVRTPVLGDEPMTTDTHELRAESTPGATARPAGPSAAHVLVTRTSPVPLSGSPDTGPLLTGGDPDEPIRLWWWRWRHPTELNFGDEVTAPVLERLTGRRVVWTPLARAEVVGAGSVLQLTLRRRKGAMPLVWGAGMIRPFKGEAPADLVPRAVRGRLSLESLSPAAQASAALGDPGILADRLVDGPVSKRYALGVVPHYKDVDDPTMRAIAALPGVRLVDVAWTPEEVAREIAACEVVVSSSMHGLIFADALGVPNARLKVSDKLVGGDHKFRDYCSAFGPDRYQPPLTPGDVRDRDLDGLVELVRSRFRPPDGIDDLKRGLVEVLPR